MLILISPLVFVITYADTFTLRKKRGGKKVLYFSSKNSKGFMKVHSQPLFLFSVMEVILKTYILSISLLGYNYSDMIWFYNHTNVNQILSFSLIL